MIKSNLNGTTAEQRTGTVYKTITKINAGTCKILLTYGQSNSAIIFSISPKAVAC